MKPTFCAPFPGMHQQFTQEDMDYLKQVLVQVRKPRMNPNLSPQGFLGYLTTNGTLIHLRADFDPGCGWKRVPSEDKEVEVEV